MPLLFFNMIWEMGPLGLLNVVTYLERNGYPALHVFLTKHGSESPEELDAVLDFIEMTSPDLIGFSLMTFNFQRTRRISMAIRERYPAIPQVWGGIHPTFEPEECLQFADYVCVGEGEEATLELVRAIEAGTSTSGIQNIWHMNAGTIFRNDVRPLKQNLDEYPFPRINWKQTYCLDEGGVVPLTHTLYRKYVMYTGTMYDIMASRGCPYSCTYCGNSLFRNIYRGKGRYVRYRSVDSLIAELEYVTNEFPYVNMINIQDDGFAAASEEYLREFADKYRSIHLPLRLRIIPTSFTEKKAELLAEANTLVAVLGIQSSERINKEIFNRHVPSEVLLKAARMLKAHRIVGQYDLIVRNPYETEEDVVDICKLLAKIPKPYQLAMFPLAFFPNTPLRSRARADGIPLNETDGYSTAYGTYPIKFPYFLKLQSMSPYTPGPIIEFFIRHRYSKTVRLMFNCYHAVVYRGMDKVRQIIMKSTSLVTVTKKIIFLPGAILAHIKRSEG